MPSFKLGATGKAGGEKMGASRMRQESQRQDFDVLPPSRRQRTAAQLASGFNEDVSDAYFVVIDDTARHADKTKSNDNRRSAERRGGKAVRPYEALMAEVALKAETFLERFSDRAFAVMVALIFGMVFMLASGLAATQMSTAPARAEMLDITHASITPQDKNGMRVLLINGIVENHSAGPQQVPRIRADILNDGRLVASTLIDTAIASLERGHSRGFAAKIQHPGGKSPELRLSFVERDALAR